VVRHLTVVALLVSAALGCASAEDPSPPGAPPGDEPQAQNRELAPPAPHAGIPRARAELAERLTLTQRALDGAIDRWRSEGDPARGAPPSDVTLYALHQQRIHLLLAKRRGLAAQVLARVPGRVAAHARATLRAKRELSRLYVPVTRSHWRTGPAAPAGELLRFYREARRRFGVPVNVLAAVNLIESAFGRLRNTSTAGAQGPMQFIPSTWAAYGRGGDVHDPHDAILGAARFLAASGARYDEAGALYRYNPSSLYVTAVSRYLRVMRRDPLAFYAFYASGAGE
jgi:soluble lytic murein transglycosylase-like protein